MRPKVVVLKRKAAAVNMHEYAQQMLILKHSTPCKTMCYLEIHTYAVKIFFERQNNDKNEGEYTGSVWGGGRRCKGLGEIHRCL